MRRGQVISTTHFSFKHQLHKYVLLLIICLGHVFISHFPVDNERFNQILHDLSFEFHQIVVSTLNVNIVVFVFWIDCFWVLITALLDECGQR